MGQCLCQVDQRFRDPFPFAVYSLTPPWQHAAARCRSSNQLPKDANQSECGYQNRLFGYLSCVDQLAIFSSVLRPFPAVSVPTTVGKLACENIQMQTILIWAWL